MKARLFAPVGEFSQLDLTRADRITVGRQPENDLSISSSRVSGRHAVLEYDADEGAWFLEDLKSTNGTFLAGLPVTGRTKLLPLDVVSFGGVEFVFQARDTAPARAASPSADRTRLEGVDDRTRLETRTPPDDDRTRFEGKDPA